MTAITLDEVNKLITEKISYYKQFKDIEIEFRLGYVDYNSKFNSYVPELFFNKILQKLNNTSVFTKQTKIYTDYFYKNVRTSDHQTFITKEKLCTLDFTIINSPLDLRISFSREILVPELTDQITYIRNKNRDSFIYKNWSYDLTTVSFEENSVKKSIKEIEIEIINLDAVSEYLASSSILKIIDLIKMCENEDKPYIYLLKK